MESSNLIAQAGRCATLLSALANKNRLAIIYHLIEEEELPVGAIAHRVGLSQSALSQHLAKLRMLDLVCTRRDRQSIYYSCNSDHVRVLMATLDELFRENKQ